MSTPSSPNACPNCGSGEIVHGRLLDVVGIGGGTAFRPKGRGFFGWLFRRDADLNNPTHACSKCGLLWTFVDVKRLV
jgi:ribosomal protein S27AE